MILSQRNEKSRNANSEHFSEEIKITFLQSIAKNIRQQASKYRLLSIINKNNKAKKKYGVKVP